ncbi:GIY-YIG nuclease family protein [Micrococcus sp. IITD107]|uniref:GIY-YIG nuclease family protein n=1 Tax=Micrococcus sp. IITD107 TaxID=3342790 RepID=UPI0035BAFCAD
MISDGSETPKAGMRNGMSAGRQIKLFLAEGKPGGLTTAEIMNWTGHIVSASRSDLAQLLGRGEPQRTGVYILLGDQVDAVSSHTRAVYVGEGDDISSRLKEHARSDDQGGKDFWDRVLVCTSKDANLTKAHARYLESRLISVATSAGRSSVLNVQKPEPTALPEADIADMEYFLSQLLIVLPVLGVNEFKSPITAPKRETEVSRATRLGTGETESPIFIFSIDKHGIEARGLESDGEFVVLRGSRGRPQWVQTQRRGGYRSLFEKLLENGSITTSPEQSTATFTRDVPFSSPSAAASVVAGRAANGRKSWKSEATGETFGEWENRGVNTVSA